MNAATFFRALALSSAFVLAACSDKPVDPPAELVDIKPTLQVKKLWSDGLGGDAKHLRLGLQPAVADGVVYAASHDGEVIALTADKGRRLWRVKTKLQLGGGPAVGEGIVALGSTKGELVALEAQTGKTRWQHQLSGEIIARPTVSNGLVFVRTVDGFLTALSEVDGSVRWSSDQPVPKLSLRGTSAPVVVDGLVYCGFDNGKLVAFDVASGDMAWNTAISSPSGRTELDRLADVDSVAAVSGRDVFVAGYQGKVAMLDRESGQIWWSKEASSYRGVSIDDNVVYMTRADGGVTALRRTDGQIVWEQNALHQRGLTTPAQAGDDVIVGDFEGYLHWLSKTNGSVQARVKTDGERITNAPVVADGRIFVQTDAGKLIAFETKPKG